MRKHFLSVMTILFLLFPLHAVRAQETEETPETGEDTNEQVDEQEDEKPAEVTADIAGGDDERVTVNLKNAKVEDFLDLVSERTGKKFLVKPSAADRRISAFLPNVSLQNALPVILGVHDLTLEEVDDNIVVVSVEEDTEEETEDEELEAPREPELQTEVIKLKFSDASDVKATTEELLSDHGRMMVVKRSGHTGWGFGSNDTDEGAAFETREREDRSPKEEITSQLLVVVDTSERLETIQKVIDTIDIRPEQVAISARIMEVNRDNLEDIGFDWGTGATGAESSDITATTPWGGNMEFQGNILGSQVAPSHFDPQSDISGSFPYDAGMSLLFSKIGGTEYQMLAHALQEEAGAEVLSAPKLLTLDSREAVFLVGSRFPILESDVSGTESTQVTTSLDYYENIGIQLNVVPQIQDDGYINMIIHPVVSEQNGTVTAKGSGGEDLAEYPIIETRETELQVMARTGETIVIAGLLKDITRKSVVGVPILEHLPLLGALFRRETEKKEKVDLFIFLSADVIEDPAEATEERMRELDKRDRGRARAVIREVDKLREEDDYETALQVIESLEMEELDISDKMRQRVEKRKENIQDHIAPEEESEEETENVEEEEQTSGEDAEPNSNN